jgi:MFS family permease
MNSQVSIRVVTQKEETALYQRAFSRLIWKLDRRLIPFLALLEINRFGFQVAIGLILIFFLMFHNIHQVLTGHAHRTTFKKDLELTTEQVNWATSAFFLAYVSFSFFYSLFCFKKRSLFICLQLTFAIPSSLILRLLGTTRYLSLSLILWGAITISMAFVTNAAQFITLRFLLVSEQIVAFQRYYDILLIQGMVTAGYFPGIITYLSLWYRKREQIMRIAIFCTATFASGAVCGALVNILISNYFSN